MAIRLALAGASGTGKTTIARWVSGVYNIPSNPIGSRSVAKSMGFQNPYDVDKAGKRAEFQRKLVTEKCGWEVAHEDFVVDRTTLDNLVYTMLHDVYSVDRSLLDSIIKGLERYTHIIVCPVDVFINVGDDPNRVKSEIYHELYDASIQALLKKYTPPSVHTLVLQESGIVTRRIRIRKLLDDGV